jgi:ribosomal protein S18 acetylase RimI-like enzyme
VSAPDVRYRTATPADAEAVSRFLIFSFTDTFGHLYPPEDLAAFLSGWTPDGYRVELENEAYGFRLAETAEGVRALGKIGPATIPFDAGGRRATELRQLYVAPELKGAGVADTLMEWLLGEALGRGFEDIYLSVFVDNARARRFYERHGFVEVGTYAFRVGNVVDDDRVMRRRLR